MSRSWFVAGAAVVAAVAGCALVATAAPQSATVSIDCFDGFVGDPIANGGVRLSCVADPTAPTTVPVTTPPTTVPPTTVPVTTAPPATPPATTAPPATPPATTAPSTTTPATVPPSGDFVETFSGDVGLERFALGIYHRGGVEAGKPATVQADHDHACGDPSTQRTVHRAVPAESFYLCRDHLMTAVGDWTGYSIAWFEPAQTFDADETTTVSWDVNVTDLGSRQWWEVVLTPAGFTSGVAECPHCSGAPGGTAAVAGVPEYPPGSVVVGLGPFGDPQFPGVPWWFSEFCSWVDGDGCSSKTIRRTISITDNQDGTLTTSWDRGDEVSTFTGPGAFPDEFRVVFKDHNYTPDKDGPVAGHTWHWDTIAIN